MNIDRYINDFYILHLRFFIRIGASIVMEETHTQDGLNKNSDRGFRVQLYDAKQ